jgi:hypothetical protein
MALGMKPQAGSAQRQPVTGRTGKQADRQAGEFSDLQPVSESNSGSFPMAASCRHVFGSTAQTGSSADMQPFIYAGM